MTNTFKTIACAGIKAQATYCEAHAGPGTAYLRMDDGELTELRQGMGLLLANM